jgi:hypothetical protein
LGYKITGLQNTSPYHGNPSPTIIISEGEEGWEEAYKNWLSGKSPTNSKEWKKGVVATTKIGDENEAE